MMNVFSFIVPVFILIVFVVATIKIKPYDNFVNGVNGVIALLCNIFPYLCAVLIMSELCEKSGLTQLLEKLLSPIFSFFNIPSPLIKLILLKPLSGSGSLALLSEIFEKYSPDSYIGRCAGCIFGSSETIFYISALYSSKCKTKRLKWAITISLISTFISCIFACFICKVLA